MSGEDYHSVDTLSDEKRSGNRRNSDDKRKTEERRILSTTSSQYRKRKIVNHSNFDSDEDWISLDSPEHKRKNTESSNKDTRLEDSFNKKLNHENDLRKLEEIEIEKRRIFGKEKEFDLNNHIEKIKQDLKRIILITSKELHNKLSFTRFDQNSVKTAVFNVQENIMDVLLNIIKNEKDMKLLEIENRNLKEELKKKNNSVSYRNKNNSENSENNYDNINEIVSVNKVRTYAQVSKSNEFNNISDNSDSDKIKGRVVKTGKKGWKTPPLCNKNENAIIVSSIEEKDFNKLVRSIAEKVSAKELGGAPKSVRKIKDGEVIIIPNNKEQEAKIKEKLNGLDKIEFKQNKSNEPL